MYPKACAQGETFESRILFATTFADDDFVHLLLPFAKRFVEIIINISCGFLLVVWRFHGGED
jgi:hypothetical protein